MMVQGTAAGFRFTADEILLLTALLGGRQLFGLTDGEGLTEVPEDLLRPKWHAVQRGLVDKGFLDETLQVDEVIRWMLETLAHPTKVLQVRRFRNSVSQPAFVLYMRNDTLVALAEEPQGKGWLLLPFASDREVLAWLDLEPGQLCGRDAEQEPELDCQGDTEPERDFQGDTEPERDCQGDTEPVRAPGTPATLAELALQGPAVIRFMAAVEKAEVVEAFGLLKEAGLSEPLAMDAAVRVLSRACCDVVVAHAVSTESMAQEILLQAYPEETGVGTGVASGSIAEPGSGAENGSARDQSGVKGDWFVQHEGKQTLRLALREAGSAETTMTALIQAVCGAPEKERYI